MKYHEFDQHSPWILLTQIINQPKKYLLPGNNSNSLNNFGNEIYLSDKLKTNGKWLVMGINLTNNLNNGSSLNYNNTTLIKTLNKIKNVVNTN